LVEQFIDAILAKRNEVGFINFFRVGRFDSADN